MKHPSHLVKSDRSVAADLRRVPVQARGRRTVARVLDAAAEQFVAVGYDAATTTQIAARAGVSVGSVYQFFADKEALLDALAECHAAGIDEVLSSSQQLGERASLVQVVDAIVDGVIAYACQQPFLGTLLVGASSPAIARVSERLRGELAGRVELVITRKPISQLRRRRVAAVCVDLLVALLPRVLDESGSHRRGMERELKLALAAYLGAVDSDSVG
jgi:AcrR family transcriptional regulator